jgi:hypothetical protein
VTFQSREFRALEKMVAERIESLKAEAVSTLIEPDGTHAHRVGAVLAFRNVLDDMREIEKSMYGEPRS